MFLCAVPAHRRETDRHAKTPDSRGWTALHYAIGSPAVDRDKVACVRVCAAGMSVAGIDASDRQNERTALQIAAAMGHAGMVGAILDGGRRPAELDSVVNRATEEGWTAYHIPVVS